jgi:hypothetical protein
MELMEVSITAVTLIGCAVGCIIGDYIMNGRETETDRKIKKLIDELKISFSKPFYSKELNENRIIRKGKICFWQKSTINRTYIEIIINENNKTIESSSDPLSKNLEKRIGSEAFNELIQYSIKTLEKRLAQSDFVKYFTLPTAAEKIMKASLIHT